jgi:DNA-binding NarL/FixJ family response regulator
MITLSPKIKVIIADDHPVFRSGMEAALNSMGFISKVSQAANGEEVIKLLSHEQYHIVLMDIKMSPMDGLEATEIVSNRYPQTRVIAMSMHDDERNILEIINKGAIGYLIKNADKGEVEKAIREVMIGHPYFSNQVAQILYDQIKQSKNVSPKDIMKNERFRDIMFLIGHEFTSEEIAEILFLSARTIEDYRRQILDITKCKSTVGLTKYIIEKGILEDLDLKQKFTKILTK